MEITEHASEKFSLTDDEIALSFSVYFNWGYPDYVRVALQRLVDQSPAHDRIDRNKELSWKQLNLLLEQADSLEMRLRIAMSPFTPQSVLNFLAKTADNMVVRRVAENYSTHVATLTRLVRHHSPDVRMAVGEHHDVPEPLLQILARDPDSDVRYSLAENPTMPATVLEILSSDENPYVAARAQRTLELTAPVPVSVPAQVVTADFSKPRRTRVARI